MKQDLPNLPQGPNSLTGTVVAVQANYYHVRLDSPPSVSTLPFLRLLCTRRTRLKKIGQKVMVGDQVRVVEIDWQDGRGAIAEVFARRSELLRPPVANAQQLLLVFALAEPDLDPWQLSRFLVTAEATSLELCLCLNKQDLLTPAQRQQWRDRLQEWGYDPMFVSVKQQQGLVALQERLRQKITIVAGPSGVGKSSLINYLIPDLELRVGKVSGKLQKGRHTTRHTELFELTHGGLLADSPGFNQPLLEINPQQLVHHFPEARPHFQHHQCQFKDCSHRQEPNCALEKGWERYGHYVQFLEEAIARQGDLQQRSDEDDRLKLKISRRGEKTYEPRLKTQKYRRQSRRQRHQDLQDVYNVESLKDLEDEDFE